MREGVDVSPRARRAGAGVLLLSPALLCGLLACSQARRIAPEDKVCDTVTPGAFGAPVPTSCHPRYPARRGEGGVSGRGGPYGK